MLVDVGCFTCCSLLSAIAMTTGCFPCCGLASLLGRRPGCGPDPGPGDPNVWDPKGEPGRHQDGLLFLGSLEGDLVASHCDPEALACLAACSKMLHGNICCTELVRRRAEDWQIVGEQSERCHHLEHLAFSLAMRELLGCRWNMLMYDISIWKQSLPVTFSGAPVHVRHHHQVV